MATEQEIAALHRERAMYEAQGKTDRALEVDAALEGLGVRTADRTSPPKGRRSRPVEHG